VNDLKKPLPTPVAEAIKQDFILLSADADLKAANEDFIKKHSQNVEHLQRAFDVRYHLDDSTKPQNESDLQKLLDLPLSCGQAVSGLKLLGRWNSDASVIDTYRKTAAKKWPYATIFQE